MNPEYVYGELYRQSYFEKLVKTYSNDLYRFAFWLSNNHSVSDDLVQETFLRAWKALHTLKDEKKAKAWLITILHRENLRKCERKKVELVDIDELIIQDHINLDPRLHIECIQLQDAILSLKVKYSEPLLLQVIGGFNSCEISKILELKINTVNVRLYRARNQLKNLRSIDSFIADFTYS